MTSGVLADLPSGFVYSDVELRTEGCRRTISEGIGYCLEPVIRIQQTKDGQRAGVVAVPKRFARFAVAACAHANDPAASLVNREIGAIPIPNGEVKISAFRGGVQFQVHMIGGNERKPTILTADELVAFGRAVKDLAAP